MSMIPTGNKNAEWKLYYLTLVDSEGVFDKYQVNRFTVSTERVRYYDISRISRAYHSVDEYMGGTISIPDNSQTIETISFEVGICWEVKPLDGKVTYFSTKTETITVTAKYVGYIRYEDGYRLFSDACDSHYVAFSIDREIDSLVSASVAYTATPVLHEYSSAGFGTQVMDDGTTLIINHRYTYGDSVDDVAHLFAEKTGEYNAGLFGSHFSWAEIEKTSDFIANEQANGVSFSSSTLDQIKTTDFVLRFLNTSYSMNGAVNLGAWSKDYTTVSNVTLLKLDFVTDGVPYHYGVVDNEVTGSQSPSGEYDDYEETIFGKIEDIEKEIKLFFSELSNIVKSIVALVALVFVVWIIVSVLRTLWNMLRKIFKRKK